MGYSRKNAHPPDGWQTGNSRGRGVDGSGNPSGRGGSEPKNSSSGITFNFNLDWYILTT